MRRENTVVLSILIASRRWSPILLLALCSTWHACSHHEDPVVGDEAGITLFLRSIEVGGPRREPYRYLARCYLALGKFTEAGEAVKPAIATSPDDAVAADPAVQSLTH